MVDCLFCKIIAGDIPSSKIYEDEKTFAFLDINPVNPGHTIVVPKKHSRNLYDIEKNDWLAVMKTVKMLTLKIKEGMDADGISVAMSNEPSAGQTVFHTHVHIVPRIEDDGLPHWPEGTYKDGEAQEVANKIINIL